MKKSIYLILLTCLLAGANAYGQKKEVTITAGGLQAALAGETLPALSELVIKGVMDASDLQYLDGNVTELTVLDMSGVTKFAVYPDAFVPYNEDEIPQYYGYPSKNLTTLLLPQSLKSINDGSTAAGAFSGNQNLTSVTFPATLETIGSRAFMSTGKLKSVTLPAGLKTIGQLAFQPAVVISATTARGLESINFPDGLERIEASAFANTKIAEVRLPAGLKELGPAFYGTEISSFSFPQGVKLLDIDGSGGKGFFENCTKLKTVGPLPKSTTRIGNNMFKGSGIESYLVDDHITSIGNSAFENTTQLTTVELPAGITEIGRDAFSFSSTTNVFTSLKIHNPLPPILTADPFRNVNFDQTTLYVPVGSKALYQEFDFWNQFKNIVEFSDKESQTISDFADITAQVGDVVELKAKASSNLEVSYKIENGKENVATLSGNKLTIVGPGTAKITATQLGNDEWITVEQIVTLTVIVNYDWLEAPTITVEGNIAKVVGPGVDKFVKFYINGTLSELQNGAADLAGKTGEIELKATTADGAEVIRLKVTK